jgi:hypothetical protein
MNGHDASHHPGREKPAACGAPLLPSPLQPNTIENRSNVLTFLYKMPMFLYNVPTFLYNASPFVYKVNPL